MSGAGPASNGARDPKKLPISYSPEWMALREHTKEVERL
jgi:hypothetical protein